MAPQIIGKYLKKLKVGNKLWTNMGQRWSLRKDGESIRKNKKRRSHFSYILKLDIIKTILSIWYKRNIMN